jgi:subtilisin family serine protease
MRTRTKIVAIATLAAFLAACTPPVTQPAVTVQSTTGITQVTVSNGLGLVANTTSALTLNWSVNGVAGGNSTVGTVNPTTTPSSTSGTIQYFAPATVPTPPTVTVRATNTANPSDFGEINLTIIQTGQGGISGTITIPSGLLSVQDASNGLEAQSLPQAQVFKPDWSLPHTPGQVLILSSNTSGGALRIASAASLQNVRLERISDSVSRATVPAGQNERAFAERITQETGALVQPNYIYQTLDAAPVPNDPLYSEKQFYLTQIDASGAWITQKTVPDGLIAVLDTGVDLTHPDLAGRVTAGKDFCPAFNASNVCEGEDNDPTDIPAAQGGGHGTGIIGIAGAATNNAAGISGVTWGGKILAVKVFGVFNNTARSESAALAKGVTYAVDQGAKVINMSLGLPNANPGVNPDKLLADAIAYADSKNVLIVAAAGNYFDTGTADNAKTLFYPASDSRVVPVGAVDQSNNIAYFSARGSDRVIMAPGEQSENAQKQVTAGIWSTALGGAFAQSAGTSEASPMVAAVAGLIRAKNPSLTALEVKGILQSTARDLGANGRDTTFGFGLLQAGAALAKTANPSAPPPPQTTVYVYADKLKAGGNPSTPGDYDGNDPQAGRTVVILSGTSGSVNYSITAGRDGKSLQPGTYLVTACVNKNSNGIACDPGDLGARNPVPQNYSGAPINGVNITVKQQ